MSSPKSHESKATSVEKILTDSQLSEGVEINDFDITAPIQEYPSHFAVSDLGCDNQGVMMGEGDA